MGSRGRPDLVVKPKCNPIMGELPVLQYCPVENLLIDEAYQRSLELAASITLVRRIATFWDWGLCQPLYVARRAGGALYVVDGQHRLAAAKLRSDIFQLPCVVRTFDTPQAEAAAFVALNQERRPLSKLQIFKAAIAAGDFEASQIVIAVTDAGLHLASSTNLETCRPGALSNVAGLQNCYRAHGVQVLTTALRVLATAYEGQVLRYAGMVFPGVVALVSQYAADEAALPAVTALVASRPQHHWVKHLLRLVADDPNLNRSRAAIKAFEEVWASRQSQEIHDCGGHAPPVLTRAPANPKPTFEEQCARVERGEAKISDVVRIPTRADPTGTLGGVGTSML